MTEETAYLTPDQLRIAPIEHTGLIQLADDLERGLIAHAPHAEDEGRVAPRAFNMNYDCGAACCIMGWLRHRGQYVYACGHHRMHVLFYPPPFMDWDDITPAQGAAAIRNFLATGEPQWQRVVEL